jgi:hypothetical protein
MSQIDYNARSCKKYLTNTHVRAVLKDSFMGKSEGREVVIFYLIFLTYKS